MDISHYYIEQGTGYPFILLHGNGEDSSYFSNQINEFSLMYHVFAIDTRGHGKQIEEMHRLQSGNLQMI